MRGTPTIFVDGEQFHGKPTLERLREAVEAVAMRTALVTGAGRGIGRGIALGLAQAGYAVALVGRTRAHLDAVAEEIGGAVCVAAADLVDADRRAATPSRGSRRSSAGSVCW